MATYAAMVSRMDQAVGEVLAAVKKRGRPTCILFLSDNGADPFSVVDAAMLKQGKLPGDLRSNYQPGFGWAYAANTPWRLYKISQHGGGVTSGAIFWQSNQVQSSQVSSAPLHVVDIAPTMLKLAGQSQEKGNGVSFSKAESGFKRPLFFQYVDNRAIRTHRWTLAEVDDAGWELFDASLDPFERNDLSKKHPQIVARMAAQWNNWWKRENSGKPYRPVSTQKSPHYSPQGDRGTGAVYRPSRMPEDK